MKVLRVILAVALAFSCVTPIFATSTGSALSFDDQWLFEAAGIQPIEKASIEAAEIKAAAASPSGTQSDPIYVRQSISPTTVEWYWLDSDGELDSNLTNEHGYYSGYEGMTEMLVRSLKNFNDRLWYHQTENDDGTTSEAGLLLIERNLLGAYVALLEMQPNVSGILTALATTNTRLNTINSSIGTTNTKLNSLWNWNSTFNTTITLPRYRQNYEGGTGSDLSLNPSGRSLPNQLWYWLSTLNASSVYAFRDLVSGVSVNSTQTYLDKDLQPISMGRTSFWRDFRNIGGNINDLVARLAYVLASDDEIAARAQAANNQAAIVDDFVNPNGAGSISVSDIGDMADLSDSMKDTFSSNVDPSIIFDGVSSNSHAWDWFSNDVKNALAYNPSRGSDQLRSSPSAYSPTPYLDAYYHDVQEALGVNLW